MQQSWTGDTIGRPIRSKLFVSFTLIGQNLNITSMGGRKGLLAKVVTSIDARVAGVVALLALLLRPPPAPPPLLLLLLVLLPSLGQLLAPSLPWLLRRRAVRDDCRRHLNIAIIIISNQIKSVSHIRPFDQLSNAYVVGRPLLFPRLWKEKVEQPSCLAESPTSNQINMIVEVFSLCLCLIEDYSCPHGQS